MMTQAAELSLDRHQDIGGLFGNRDGPQTVAFMIAFEQLLKLAAERDVRTVSYPVDRCRS
jgi:hypothetical protein